MRVSVCAAIIVALCACTVNAWGPIGHTAIGDIAQQLLNSNAAGQANSILNGQTLGDVANWADSVKSEPAYAWSAVLHYIDTPDWQCTYTASDCPNAQCVAGAIANYTQRVTDSSLPSTQIQEALKFLVHFVGDVHQPLHVAFASDRGGNSIQVTYNGHSDNLHMVWDTYLIENRINVDFGGDQSKYTSFLYSQVTGPWSSNVTNWDYCPGSAPAGASCPATWAAETGALACTNAYKDEYGNVIQSGDTLDDGYYQNNIPVIELQLGKAAVRLAHLVNALLGGGESDLLSNVIADM